MIRSRIRMTALAAGLALAAVASQASPAGASQPPPARAFEQESDNCLRRAEAHGVGTITQLEQFAYSDPWCSWRGYYAVVPLTASLTLSRVRLHVVNNRAVTETEVRLWWDPAVSWENYYLGVALAMLQRQGGRYVVMPAGTW